MDGVIRPAESRDLPRLTEIYNQAIRTGTCTCDLTEFTEEARLPWFREHQDPAWPLFVCELDSAAIGYAYLSPYRKGREALQHVAEISYYVDFAFHGCGVGSALMTRTVAEARRLGYRSLIAILLACNEPSIALLRKSGFTEWGRLPEIAELPGGTCSHLYYGMTL